MLKFISQLFTTATLGFNAAIAQANPPQVVIHPETGNRYFLTDILSWEEARDAAIAAGGHLVTINDEPENQWLAEQFLGEGVDFLWIGISDRATEGEFEWVSGQPVTYTNWAPGEPNDNPERGGEDFGVLTGPANPFDRPIGSWSDAPTPAKLRGIVEIDRQN
ncbi:C-type lectin domain-containing protein [Lyngbya sp. CCY1209]|jgi:hypothetical protein|uniref:C-type lectin domain-containing protein n=1 Tax=Lyngbya sp. CCY1209 TaxID=2886103 RepID=UPI002D20A577|nr:C-type lectin domain-containing protein [Lyngbya sp. CCY1209]MEB3883732.1 hypothetical protein [Lyngbya sp. CCY1209]